MITCCNRHFTGEFRHVLSWRANFYRKIEFGICPCCKNFKFIDYRIINNDDTRIKTLSGKEAVSAYEKILKRVQKISSGSKSNMNYHYGDFKKTKKVDEYGNPVYLQLRKNFNNESEVLGEIYTRTYK